MTPTEFIDGFEYRRGFLIDGIRNVSVIGDCDDFTWSLLVLIEGGRLRALKALASGRAELWCVKSPQNGAVPRHTALWHRDYGWIDSTFDWWRGDEWPHEKWWKRRLITVIPLVLWGTLPGKITGVAGLVWWNWPLIGWILP